MCAKLPKRSGNLPDLGDPGSRAGAPKRKRGKAASASNVQATPVSELTAALVKRRRAVREWWEGTSAERPEGLVGLALSGGGIRSATFSLGVIQGLAKSSRDALSRIDIVSSVSGGGYIACFLRSLFMPQGARGILPKLGKKVLKRTNVELDEADLADQHAFAREVLASGPNEKNLSWPTGDAAPVKRRNPLWWLREHSRFLAPNGPTDYGFSLAYIARNWLALLYVFMLASLAVFSSLALVEGGARLISAGIHDWTWIPLGTSAARDLPCGACAIGSQRVLPVSPLFLFTVLTIAASIIFSIAYWMTEAMSPNEPDIKRQWKNLGVATAGAILSGAAIIAIGELITPGAFDFGAPDTQDPHHGALLVWLITTGIILMMLGTATALVVALRLRRRGVALTSELRSKLTHWLATTNRWFLIVVAVALVDTIGAGLAYWFRTDAGQTFGTAGAATLPILAFLIKKLPDWFGGTGKGALASLLQRFFNTVALLAGIFLFGMLAVAAAAIVHLVLWTGNAWVSAPDWDHFFLFLLVVWILTLLSGRSTGFINLSSLHLLYSSRLTRAYLGASNSERLESAAAEGRSFAITDRHSSDYIQPQLYSSVDLPAPIHIINATINETIDPQSQLVARDRKGNVISVEPHGVRVDEELVQWSKVGDPDCAEQLSIGQWCAISGAAASSGMGRMTNLGLALAFTFANVRLGYWWWSPGVCTEASESVTPAEKVFSKYFGTFVYLFNEMTARYSRGYQRKYLTDGGHFENTAAYRLIEKKVPLIIVSDNGADPEYRFEDLENLVRKARLDLGAELMLLEGAELREFVNQLGATDLSVFVDPALGDDWRGQFGSGVSRPFILILRARIGDDVLHLIWLKPRVIDALPADVLGYSAANVAFPQQPTADQFFDEAQWESYRKLGELSMTRLLDVCPKLLA